MILVTVGSTLFPFTRMANLVQEIAAICNPQEKIIFQYGRTPPKGMHAHIELHAFISHEKLMDGMKRARVIICHGGPATIYQALSFGKIPWVLPRQKQFGEHLNDHQVDFCRFMAKRRLVCIIADNTLLKDIFIIKSKTKPVQENNSKLITHLDSLVAGWV